MPELITHDFIFEKTDNGLIITKNNGDVDNHLSKYEMGELKRLLNEE